jgi:hypothetical protein
MKWNSFLLAVVVAPAFASSWSVPAGAQDAATSCVNDVDCIASGTACGTEVCDWNMGKVCVPAVTASMLDTWCGDSPAATYDAASADIECKCYAEGAVCMNYHCTIWFPPDAGSSGASGTASGGSAPTEDAGAGGAGGSSGGCSVSFGEENASLTFGALGFVGCVAVSRRRLRGPPTSARRRRTRSSGA